VYRASPLRRVGYPCAVLLLAGVSVFKWHLDREPVLLNCGILLVAAGILLFLYINTIRLAVGPGAISLRWPLAGKKTIEWKEVVEVRRSDSGAPENFFVDIIASPDRSIQFNPYFFEKPAEIIDEMDRYLRSELIDLDREAVSEVLAIAAEAAPPVASHWALALIIVIGAALVVWLFF